MYEFNISLFIICLFVFLCECKQNLLNTCRKTNNAGKIERETKRGKAFSLIVI